MRRRRPFPPRFPRPARPFGPPLPDRQVPPLLIKANQLYQQGKYEEAARLFNDLADRAGSRGNPKAPLLYVQTGKSYILAGNNSIGYEILLKGFGILVQQQRWHDLQRMGYRIISDLRQQGIEDVAKQIENWLEKNLVVQDSTSKISPDPDNFQKKRAILPLSCLSCGAAVYPDEVTWVDEITVECNYCGNLIRGESS